MTHEIILSGFGGQGIMAMGKMLAEAGMQEGLSVNWLPSYGPEVRGGTANCSVMLSSEPIVSPIVQEPTEIIVMNKPSLLRFEPQLKSGGLEWGLRDGKIVFTMVGKQFIDFPINHLTRYGQQESVSLPAGEYRVTGIGLEMHTSFSVKKVLERGAFFNEDAVVFRIEPGSVSGRMMCPPVISGPSIIPKLIIDAQKRAAPGSAP